MAVTLVPLAQLALLLAAYDATPSGLTFTGNLDYGEDGAQHELWARQMWAHGFAPNLLTPGRTPRSWFFSPLEWTYGGLRALTGLPYPVVTAVFAVVCTPFLALGLVALARRARIRWPCTASVLAVSLGGLGPLVSWWRDLGIPGVSRTVAHAAVSASGDATAAAAGLGPYQLLVVIGLLGLAVGGDGGTGGFVRAGAAFALLAAVYPFYTPVLLVTAVVSVAVWSRHLGRRPTAHALAWLVGLPAIPALYYLALPDVDPEFARFQDLNHQALLSSKVFVTSFAIGLLAVACAPLLLRSTPPRQVLGVLAPAVLVALWVPPYPWRTHLLHFTPFLTLGVAAGATMLSERLHSATVRSASILLGTVVIVSGLIATPYYLWREADAASRHTEPEFVTRGQADALQWIAARRGTEAVLAPPGAAPWVAAWGGHHTLVGHYLWTHHYRRNRAAVEAVYRGQDPRPLLRRFRVRWVLVDRARAPRWIEGVAPRRTFHGTDVYDAASVMRALDADSARPESHGRGSSTKMRRSRPRIRARYFSYPP